MIHVGLLVKITYRKTEILTYTLYQGPRLSLPSTIPLWLKIACPQLGLSWKESPKQQRPTDLQILILILSISRRRKAITLFWNLSKNRNLSWLQIRIPSYNFWYNSFIFPWLHLHSDRHTNYTQVSWDGPDDPANPKNWSTKKRWTATLLVSLFASIYPIGSTMIAPCILTISQELHITSIFLQQLCLSVFLLGIGTGPLILSPLSEVYGRVPILHAGTCFYFIWNTACGFSKTKEQLIAFRFLSGFGASAALAVGSGVMGDLWKPEERGKAIALYVLGPLLAPAFGPIAGAYVAQGASWRWVFWGMSIATVTTQAIAALFMHETFAPRLLSRKVAERKKTTGQGQWHSEYDEPGRTITRLVGRSLIRPFRLLGTHSIIQLLALYVAFFYGVLYIMLFTFPLIWTQKYHQSVGSSSLNYISTGIGYVAGSQSKLEINL